MANEGGIDQVKKKVEALGLVLDPTQYEEFQRNLNEVDLTFTGLANAFTGPLLPGATSLLETFTKWIQSPWVAEGIANIGEKLGTLASDIAKGIETGNWDDFFASIKEFTGFDLAAINTNFTEFQAASQTETAAIKEHWNQLLTAISERLNMVFGTEGINLVIDWKQIGITALQAIDIILCGLTKTWEFFNSVLQNTINLLSVVAGQSSVSAPAGYTPYPGYGQAFSKPSGGSTLRRADFVSRCDALVNGDPDCCQGSAPSAGLAVHEFRALRVGRASRDRLPSVTDARSCVLGRPVGVGLDHEPLFAVAHDVIPFRLE